MTSIAPRDACLKSTRLGLQFYAQGRHVEALQAFDCALALDDTICLTWIGKGKALLELQHFPEAQAAFERALSLDPTNADALHGKALARTPPRREQSRQESPDLPDLSGVAPLVIDGIGKGLHLIGHALVAHLRQC